ncbi:hypothetical protein D3C81_2152500 [compost metagenome]
MISRRRELVGNAAADWGGGFIDGGIAEGAYYRGYIVEGESLVKAKAVAEI